MMRISKNKFVSVTYDLNVGGMNEEQELMERATKERPLQFIFGTGSMLPAFEENIKELKAGAKFNFSIAPEDAYGQYAEDHVVELPRNIFEVNDQAVVIDFNHPLAGETLHFNGEILDIHEPSEEEIAAINSAMAGSCGCDNCGCDSCDEGHDNCGCC